MSAAAIAIVSVTTVHTAQRPQPAATTTAAVAISEAECTAAKLTESIAASRIGEPVRAVTLEAPVWVPAANTAPAHCRVDGSFLPVDTSATARPINFRVLLPRRGIGGRCRWAGGGINGVIPQLAGGDGPGSAPLIARGIATYGSDSGHQIAFGRRGGRPRRDRTTGRSMTR
jgi:feruloyl esterase